MVIAPFLNVYFCDDIQCKQVNILYYTCTVLNILKVFLCQLNIFTDNFVLECLFRQCIDTHFCFIICGTTSLSNRNVDFTLMSKIYYIEIHNAVVNMHKWTQHAQLSMHYNQTFFLDLWVIFDKSKAYLIPSFFADLWMNHGNLINSSIIYIYKYDLYFSLNKVLSVQLTSIIGPKTGFTAAFETTISIFP